LKRSKVFDAWQAIVFAEPPLTHTDQLKGWTELFDKHFRDGRLEVSAADASLITTLGCSLMCEEKNYFRAQELCEIYLAYPDAKAHPADYNKSKVDLGLVLLLEGKLQEGAEVLESAARDQGPGTVMHKGRTLGTILVRHALSHYLVDLDPLESPKHELRTLISTVLSLWPGHKRKAKSALNARTNGDLVELLEATYPNRHLRAL
jgi:hypothetical protein